MKSEKALQNFIVREAKKLDILVYKFASPARRGVPDLLLIPPSGQVFFIEVKNPNGKGRLSPLQEVECAKIGVRVAVYIVADPDKARGILRARVVS